VYFIYNISFINIIKGGGGRERNLMKSIRGERANKEIFIGRGELGGTNKIKKKQTIM